MVQYTEYPKNRPVNNTIEPPVSDRPECEEVAAYEYRTSEYLLFEGKLPEYCQPVLRRRRLERKTSLRPRSKSCVHAASKRLSTHARVQPTIHSNFRYVSLRVVSKGSSYVIHTANTLTRGFNLCHPQKLSLSLTRGEVVDNESSKYSALSGKILLF